MSDPSSASRKRKRFTFSFTMDQFHESLQQLTPPTTTTTTTTTTSPTGVSEIVYTNASVQALRMAHLVFLQVVAAELAQLPDQVTLVNEEHVKKALDQVGFKESRDTAQQFLVTATVNDTTNNNNNNQNQKTKSKVLTKKKKKQRMVVTKEMEAEQERLLEASKQRQQN
jgi:hypothetical protein